MQARICVQNFDDGDLQGFLYIDTGSGETLVTTSPRYTSGTNSFIISGTRGQVDVSGNVDIGNSQIMFTVTVGQQTPSMFTEALIVSGASC